MGRTFHRDMIHTQVSSEEPFLFSNVHEQDISQHVMLWRLPVHTLHCWAIIFQSRVPHKGRKIPPMWSSIISCFVSLKAEVSHASSRVALEKTTYVALVWCMLLNGFVFLNLMLHRQVELSLTTIHTENRKPQTLSHVLSSSKVNFVWKLMGTVRK